MSRLQEQYKSEIIKSLQSKLNCNNIHEVPKISKIVLNIGLGEAKDDNKELFLNESADLPFHYLILLQEKGFKMKDVINLLKKRRSKNK